MKFPEAKQKFLEAWGKMGSDWGISRTMAQIHALLLIAPAPLSTEDIMEQLSISRGNANMNLRALIDWKLVEKVLKPGERREYFRAEKDIWEVARRILEARKKRELEPVLTTLDELSHVEGDAKDQERAAFLATVEDIRKFALQSDKLLDKFSQASDTWFFNVLMKAMK